jgi:hypothetical protein
MKKELYIFEYKMGNYNIQVEEYFETVQAKIVNQTDLIVNQTDLIVNQTDLINNLKDKNTVLKDEVKHQKSMNQLMQNHIKKSYIKGIRKLKPGNIFF